MSNCCILPDFQFKTKLTNFNLTEKLTDFTLTENMDRNKSKNTKERRFYLVFLVKRNMRRKYSQNLDWLAWIFKIKNYFELWSMKEASDADNFLRGK